MGRDISTYAAALMVLMGEDRRPAIDRENGWSAESCDPIQGIPTPVPGDPQQKTANGPDLVAAAVSNSAALHLIEGRNSGAKNKLPVLAR